MKFVDRENDISSLNVAPDKIRAQISGYYNGSFYVRYDNDKIAKAEITDLDSPNQQLIPTKKSKIYITGHNSSFRDQTQWTDFVQENIELDKEFLDHTFIMNPITVTNDFNKNFHHPEYEDLTKVRLSNELLNYNLISYPHKNSFNEIKRIAEVMIESDVGSLSVKKIMDEYDIRLANYTGSISEVQEKQKTVYILHEEDFDQKISEFPFFYRKDFSLDPKQDYFNNDNFLRIANTLQFYNKKKNLFQALDKSVAFTNREFVSNKESYPTKIYNALQILTSTALLGFEEMDDEIFLLDYDSMLDKTDQNRFVEQVNSIKFLQYFVDIIHDQSRSLEQIFSQRTSPTFVLGYKIEKFLDNDATIPIQTYYTTSKKFIDTQLKYGRKYIYKTKVLLGILGSSYSYSNLKTSSDGGSLVGENITEKYWAEMDVRITPSFQIAEILIDDHENAFVEDPPIPPSVEFYGDASESRINMFFRPSIYNIYEETNDKLFSASSALRSTDLRTIELLQLKNKGESGNCRFVGTYEIYRLERPPRSSQDFYDNFLNSTDETSEALFKDNTVVKMNLLEASYSDKVVPNRKYYYLFRSMSYHGTPSIVTQIFQAEVRKDSDEYKLDISEYKIPQMKKYDSKKDFKRLFRVVPNLDRLMFIHEEDGENWFLDGQDNGNGLVSSVGESYTKKFKIRITSKHTGKKMDLNMTFKLKKDGSFKRQE